MIISDPWLSVPVVAMAAFVSAGIGSVVGTGGTAVFLPVLLLFFDVREAIPILTIVNLTANMSRVWLNRAELVLPVAGWFALAAVPTNVVGSLLFTRLSSALLTRMLGGVLITTVLWQRFRAGPRRAFNVRWFIPMGGVFGFLYGLLDGLGPMMAPFFLAYGLVKGSYIGTDALATVSIQLTKASVFGITGIINLEVLTWGLGLAPFMFAGTYLGKKLLHRVPDKAFRILIELTLLGAGASLLLGP